MNRRWYAGREVKVGSFHFRIIEGNKNRGTAGEHGDLVLQLRTPDGWSHVPDAVAFVIADFKYENENVLYPREQGYKGGEKHLGECRRAAKHGWDTAQAWLEHEQGELTW